MDAAWTAVPATGTAHFLSKCAKNPARWFYPCSANHRDPRRCTFEFLQSSVPVHVRVEECAYTEGGTGWRVWPCALLLAGWLVGQARELQVQGCRVLELGCGLGLPALTAAVLGAESVASDCLPVLLRTVERSACANDGPRRARIALLDWDDESSCAMTGEEYSTEQGVKAAQLAAEPQGGASEGAEAGAEVSACARLAPSERFDLLLASDVIYSVDHARQLPEVLTLSRASMPAAACMRTACTAHATAYTLHMHCIHAAYASLRAQAQCMHTPHTLRRCSPAARPREVGCARWCPCAPRSTPASSSPASPRGACACTSSGSTARGWRGW